MDEPRKTAEKQRSVKQLFSLQNLDVNQINNHRNWPGSIQQEVIPHSSQPSDNAIVGQSEQILSVENDEQSGHTCSNESMNRQINLLKAINLNLQKLNLTEIENKGQILSVLLELDGQISNFAKFQATNNESLENQNILNEIIQKTMRDINFLPFS